VSFFTAFGPILGTAFRNARTVSFILVLLDADDLVVRNQIVQNSENRNVLSAMDFVCSEGADEGLSYPMHMMVRDVNGNAAYGYLDDIDAQPEIQMVHVGEDE
jgi:hypothetical protein